MWSLIFLVRKTSEYEGNKIIVNHIKFQTLFKLQASNGYASKNSYTV
jgi:hypothetical protein